MPATDSNNRPSALKNTREAKGLTLEIVHEATKIPMDVLRAIEEGYSVRILSPFYYRGFIKIYAEFLGLDVGEMYKQYGLNDLPKPAKSVSGVKVPVTSRVSVARSNVALEQAQEWFSLVFKPRNIMLILKIIGVIIFLVMLFKIGGCVASRLNKKAIIASPEFTREKSSPASQEIKHKVIQAQSADNKVEVAVRAVKNTWLQVKVDGQVVFQMTLNKGSIENWSGDERIELSGRNIEQLDMEINGRHIGPLGGGERRVRRVVITREGLTVKR